MGMSPYIADLRKKVGHDLLHLMGINAIVVNAQKQLLLVQSRESGEWRPVGGMIEVGEEPADAVVREVLEETGVQVRPVRLTGIYDGPVVTYLNRDQAHYITFAFLCEATAGEPHAADDENFDARFWSMDALPQIDHEHGRNIRDAMAGRAEAVFKWSGS